MPRRRFRDPDAPVRDRNRWDASGSPAFGGLSRIGGAGSVGGSTVAVRDGGREGGEGVQIEHVTLEAVASQTIADGGGTVQFDTVLPAPTEVRGFDTLQTDLASSGSVGDIPVPLDGTGIIKFRFELDAAYTVDVEVVRTRELVETVLASRQGVGDVIIGTVDLSDLRADDTVAVRIVPSASATVTWGRLQFTEWGVASPTSAFDMQIAAVLRGYDNPASRPSQATVEGTSDIKAGDLLVAFVASAEPDITMPSGWTNNGVATEGDGEYRLDYRVAQSGDDTASWTWTATGGLSGDLSLAVTVAVLRGAATASPFDGTPDVELVGTGTSATLTMTSGSPTSLLLLMATVQGNTSDHTVDGMQQVTVIDEASGDMRTSVWRSKAAGGAESETVSWTGSSGAGAMLAAIRKA